MHLSTEERRRIDQCVAAFETHTGAQVVTAVVGQSDNYPEIPWKAFALGASVTALLRLLLDLARPDWLTGYGTLFDAVLILGVGATLALVTIRLHAFARMFLHGTRAETAVIQHARLLFLRHEVFATPMRNGVLILVSTFERRVVILPDTGLHAQIGDAELHPIIDRMTTLLAEGKVCDALCRGVTAVEALLAGMGFHATGNEGAGLPDAVIEVSGDDARA
jgi:putative membrane protein